MPLQNASRCWSCVLPMCNDLRLWVRIACLRCSIQISGYYYYYVWILHFRILGELNFLSLPFIAPFLPDLWILSFGYHRIDTIYWIPSHVICKRSLEWNWNAYLIYSNKTWDDPVDYRYEKTKIISVCAHCSLLTAHPVTFYFNQKSSKCSPIIVISHNDLLTLVTYYELHSLTLMFIHC